MKMPLNSAAPFSATRPTGPTARSRRSLALLGRLRNRLAAQALVPLSWCLGPRVTGTFGILMYHRVVPLPAGVAPPTWNVTPERFRAQLTGLLQRGYRAWPLRRVLAVHREGLPIPAKTFVVTFDDGYESVYRHALPVLDELHIPATVFLTTGYLDSPGAFPFDDWAWAGSCDVPAETWRPLTVAQCAEMQAGGLIELGAHSHGHADFRDCPETLRDDFAVSLGLLHERFGVSQASFAFPYGQGCRKYDGPVLSEIAREAGVGCALTTDDEVIRPGDDPLNWGRLTALESDSAASLAAKLDGWYSLARGGWRRLRGIAGRPAGTRRIVKADMEATAGNTSVERRELEWTP